MKKRYGKPIGYVLLGLGCIAFPGAIVAASASMAAASVVGGAASVATGSWLVNRLYLGDPEAVAEYKREIEKLTMSEARKKYHDFATMIQIVDADFIRAQLRDQMKLEDPQGAETMSTFLRLFPFEAVADAQQSSVYTTSELQHMLAIDVARSESFTLLWEALLGHLEKLHGMTTSVGSGTINLVPDHVCDDIRAKVFEEFSYVDQAGGVFPSAPAAPMPSFPEDDAACGGEFGDENNNNRTSFPSSNGMQQQQQQQQFHNNLPSPGHPLGVWTAFNKYASYVVTRLRISSQFVAGALAESPTGQHCSLRELVRDHYFIPLSAYLDIDFKRVKLDQYCGSVASSYGFDVTFTSGNPLPVDVFGDERSSRTPLQQMASDVELQKLLVSCGVPATNALRAIFHWEFDMLAAAASDNTRPARKFSFSWSGSTTCSGSGHSYVEHLAGETFNDGNNIVKFLYRWRAVLQQHQSVLVPAHLSSDLRYIYQTFETRRRELSDDRRGREAAFETRVKKRRNDARKKHGSLSAHRRNKESSPADSVKEFLRALETEISSERESFMSAEQRDFDEKLARVYRDMQREYVEVVRAKRSGSTYRPQQTNINISTGCAQS